MFTSWNIYIGYGIVGIVQQKRKYNAYISNEQFENPVNGKEKETKLIFTCVQFYFFCTNHSKNRALKHWRRARKFSKKKNENEKHTHMYNKIKSTMSISNCYCNTFIYILCGMCLKHRLIRVFSKAKRFMHYTRIHHLIGNKQQLQQLDILRFSLLPFSFDLFCKRTKQFILYSYFYFYFEYIDNCLDSSWKMKKREQTISLGSIFTISVLSRMRTKKNSIFRFHIWFSNQARRGNK